MFSRCSNLETLSVYVNRKEGLQVVDMIDGIVNCAHSLPKLENLYLGTTGGVDYRTQMIQMYGAVRDALKNLQPTQVRVGSGLYIHAFKRYYILRRMEDGSLRYGEIMQATTCRRP
ncbi:hypothetical protein D9758_010547 [Tetrapyrgos nigripes]|uniref:Uncharacterized protein n=1 Tax=Tetrapyrgos nigripes TaxID=182062 RepID=A0A8H5D184_9AGAR|nr:hypothetical protein D9758_010547 [Tetrapyrgos nigripes]